MKYLIGLSILLLSGCSVDFMHHMHKEAMKDGTSCYRITQPNDIIGYYCLHYEGQTLKK